MDDAYTVEQVQALLYEAGRTRMAQAVAGCWPSEYRSGMPECLRDEEDLRYAETETVIPQPTTAEVTVADQVEEWIRALPATTAVEIRRRKIVLDGMQVDPRTEQPKFSWAFLGRKHRLTADEAERVWGIGVERLTVIANRSASRVRVSTVARIRVANLRPMPGPCADTLRRIKVAAMPVLQPA